MFNVLTSRVLCYWSNKRHLSYYLDIRFIIFLFVLFVFHFICPKAIRSKIKEDIQFSPYPTPRLKGMRKIPENTKQKDIQAYMSSLPL